MQLVDSNLPPPKESLKAARGTLTLSLMGSSLFFNHAMIVRLGLDCSLALADTSLKLD